MTIPNIYSNKYFHIYLYGNIEENISIEVSEMINYANRIKNGPKAIVIHINSPGGSVASAFGMVNSMMSSNLETIAIVEGFCISAAVFILAACDKKYMSKYSHTLIHDVTYGSFGTHDDMEFHGKLSGHIVKNIKKLIQRNTNISDEEYEKLRKSEKLLTPEDCIKLGLCDAIYETKKKKPKPAKELHIYKYDNVYLYKEGKCKHCLDIFGSPMRLISQAYGSKNMLLRINGYSNSFSKEYNIMDTIGMVCYTINHENTVTALIDGSHSDADILLYIVSDIRYMSDIAYLYFNFADFNVDLGRSGISDRVTNTNAFKKVIFDILEKYTKLPKSIIDNIFVNRYSFDANECLKYGLCDAIV